MTDPPRAAPTQTTSIDRDICCVISKAKRQGAGTRSWAGTSRFDVIRDDRGQGPSVEGRAVSIFRQHDVSRNCEAHTHVCVDSAFRENTNSTLRASHEGSGNAGILIGKCVHECVRRATRSDPGRDIHIYIAVLCVHTQSQSENVTFSHSQACILDTAAAAKHQPSYAISIFKMQKVAGRSLQCERRI